MHDNLEMNTIKVCLPYVLFSTFNSTLQLYFKDHLSWSKSSRLIEFNITLNHNTFCKFS